jgi:hypothetical protein
LALHSDWRIKDEDGFAIFKESVYPTATVNQIFQRALREKQMRSQKITVKKEEKGKDGELGKKKASLVLLERNRDALSNIEGK